MMLQTALRPVQKSASRLLLAGANAAKDLKDPGQEAQPASTVLAAPPLVLGEPGLAGPAAPRPAAFDCVQPALGPMCMWRQESRWPGAVRCWLDQSAGAVPDFSELRPEPEPESPLAARPRGQETAAAPAQRAAAEDGRGPFPTPPYLWHLDGRLPAGTVVWPAVLWPAAGYAKDFGESQAQVLVVDAGSLGQQQPQPLAKQPQHAQQHGAAAAAAGAELGIAMPSRTAASRRQRRRNRLAAAAPEGPQCVAVEQELPAPAPAEPQWPAVEVRSAAEEALDVGVPGTLWPATPESTPPSSPRTAAAEPAPLHMEAFGGWGCPPMAMALEPHQAEVEECERLLAQLTNDAAGRPALLELITGRMWSLAQTQGGCRVVQKALEVAETSERVALAQPLRGHVWEACTSPHANHVLQKCIELMPADRVQFVLAELKGHAVGAARHRYGCRVLERLIEHCSSSQTAGLVDEVLAGAQQLCRHTFGNFVIQHILVHGMADQRQKVASVLCADVQRLARHRVASHVVRCALVHCSPKDRQTLALAMSADAGEFADLAHHHCGSFVVREMKRADGRRR